jgi:tyrosyl-tRNA synthetase
VTLGREFLEPNGEAAKLKLIVHCGFAASNSEARRLVGEKGIQLNGKAIDDPNGTIAIKTGDVVQRGKRKFVRVDVQRLGE